MHESKWQKIATVLISNDIFLTYSHFPQLMTHILALKNINMTKFVHKTVRAMVLYYCVSVCVCVCVSVCECVCVVW